MLTDFLIATGLRRRRQLHQERVRPTRRKDLCLQRNSAHLRQRRWPCFCLGTRCVSLSLRQLVFLTPIADRLLVPSPEIAHQGAPFECSPVIALVDLCPPIFFFRSSPAVARHSAERMSSLKVLMFLGFVLEAVGLDVGISRLLLTFLLQSVLPLVVRALVLVLLTGCVSSCLPDCRTLGDPSLKVSIECLA